MVSSCDQLTVLEYTYTTLAKLGGAVSAGGSSGGLRAGSGSGGPDGGGSGPGGAAGRRNSGRRRRRPGRRRRGAAARGTGAATRLESTRVGRAEGTGLDVGVGNSRTRGLRLDICGLSGSDGAGSASNTGLGWVSVGGVRGVEPVHVDCLSG
jgi:hypothetical protein